VRNARCVPCTACTRRKPMGCSGYTRWDLLVLLPWRCGRPWVRVRYFAYKVSVQFTRRVGCLNNHCACVVSVVRVHAVCINARTRVRTQLLCEIQMACAVSQWHTQCKALVCMCAKVLLTGHLQRPRSRDEMFCHTPQSPMHANTRVNWCSAAARSRACMYGFDH
jgi:hypothetical protein